MPSLLGATSCGATSCSRMDQSLGHGHVEEETIGHVEEETIGHVEEETIGHVEEETMANSSEAYLSIMTENSIFPCDADASQMWCRF